MEQNYFEGEVFEHLTYSEASFMDYRFIDCTFTGCVWESCELIQCSFFNCIFRKCMVTNLKATQNSQMQFCQFLDSQLIGIDWKELLPARRFAEPVKTLQNCRLKYNTFTEMSFKKFAFSGNEISDSLFAECELAESQFRGCKLDRTEYFRCNLQKADFRDAIGYQVDLASCRMRNARFSFPEAVNLLGSLGIRVE